MITFIHPAMAFGANFSPVAEIALPFQTFLRRGIEFIHDDDGYDYAAFRAAGRGLGLLQHSTDADRDTVSLFLADDFEGLSNLAQTLMDLSADLDLPPGAFHWRQNREDVSLGAERVAA